MCLFVTFLMFLCTSQASKGGGWLTVFRTSGPSHGDHQLKLIISVIVVLLLCVFGTSWHVCVCFWRNVKVTLNGCESFCWTTADPLWRPWFCWAALHNSRTLVERCSDQQEVDSLDVDRLDVDRLDVDSLHVDIWAGVERLTTNKRVVMTWLFLALL